MRGIHRTGYVVVTGEYAPSPHARGSTFISSPPDHWFCRLPRMRGDPPQEKPITAREEGVYPVCAVIHRYDLTTELPAEGLFPACAGIHPNILRPIFSMRGLLRMREDPHS